MTSVDGERLSPGARLGRYQILAELGSGGMGRVYLGLGKSEGGFQRIFAIKCCHPHLLEEPGFAEAFLEEARHAAVVHDPHVISAIDVQRDKQHLFLVMDYVEGERLSHLARLGGKAQGKLPRPAAIRIVHDVLLGLHAAHEARAPDGSPLHIVHRDVSPQNVLVGVDGVSRVMDFGIAKSVNSSTSTSKGVVKGKIAFVAPEQLRGEPADRRVDVWAVGVMLWELVTGRRLFGGRASPAETMHAILSETVPAPSKLEPDVPSTLDAVVLKALEKSPARRWSSALEMADALESLGPMAAPRVVGALVERLAFDELEHRREALRNARLFAQQTNPSLQLLMPHEREPDRDPSHSSRPPVPEPAAPTPVPELAAPTPVPEPATPTPVPEAKARPRLVAATLGAFALAALFWLWARTSISPPTSPTFVPRPSVAIAPPTTPVDSEVADRAATPSEPLPSPNAPSSEPAPNAFVSASKVPAAAPRSRRTSSRGAREPGREPSPSSSSARATSREIHFDEL